MILASMMFYLFAFVLLVSATLVVLLKNPVHSVLSLIVTFFNAAGLFVLLGAEFLGMLMVIVYVGAVAVLFLFVVMMLDIDFVELRRGFMRYLPVGILVALVLASEFVISLMVGDVLGAVEGDARMMGDDPMPDSSMITNSHALGYILYTKYIYMFQVSGFILLVAMIGAIVLTLRERATVKRQSVCEQNARDPKETIELRQVGFYQGVDDV